MTSTLAKKSTIVGVVVTYLPTPDLPIRLQIIASQVEALVIVDNSADDAIAIKLTQLARALDAQIILNDVNRGIGAALNQGVSAAIEKGADWVLFFDQDSELFPNFRIKLESALKHYTGDRPLGILGGDFIFSCDQIPKLASMNDGTCKYVIQDQVITSGSAYSVRMLTKLGPFKQDYFVDLVDTEYCWRAKKAGFQVAKTTSLMFVHNIGQTVTHEFLGRRPKVFNHNSFRRYLMGRNTILLLREYFFSLPTECVKLIGYEVRYNFIHLLLFETSRARKLMSFFYGVWHGITGTIDERPWLLAARFSK